MNRSAHERPHEPGPADLWGESWYFDFAGEDGLGGYVQLLVYPNLRVAWWWSHLLTGDGLVAVRDHEVSPPRTGLEIRADGLWADLECETPMEHWTIGLEAFGVRLDDPGEAWRDEWGERVPVGLDLEWEEAGGPAHDALPGPPGTAEGYCQGGIVHGEILVGARRIPFDGIGQRARRWGVYDWWAGGAGDRVRRHWAAYQTPGSPGASVAFTLPGAPGVEAVRGDFDDEGVPLGAAYTVDGRAVGVEVVGVAPVLLAGPGGRRARLARALCRFDDPGLAGGAAGAGWAEWLLGP